ncbi:MAG: hypothetical protein JWP00_3908 [Chloroflexi bacterium]|nr:hypothetical protein [Chloroflexota bacterium]
MLPAGRTMPLEGKFPVLPITGPGQPAGDALPLVRPSSIFIWVVALLAVAGAVLAASVLSPASQGPGTGTAARSFGVAEIIPTSFGKVSVTHAQVVNGVSAQDLAGANHGVQNYVPADHAQVQVFIHISNQLNQPVNYSPANFEMVVLKEQNPRPLLVSGASIKPGLLTGGANLDASLSFVTPRNGANLWVKYIDPVNGQISFVDLGKVDTQLETDTGDDHHVQK